MTRRLPHVVLAVLLIATLLGACGGGAEPEAETTTTSTTAAPYTILDALAGTGRHTVFLDLIGAAGLDQTFRSAGPFTLFAPNDDAFDSVGSVSLDALRADRDELRDAILYHALTGSLASSDVTDAGFATTMSGFNVDLRPGASGIEVNGIQVVGPDLTADNGVVHEVPTVLSRPDIADVLGQSQEFDNFLVAVEGSGLLGELDDDGPLTLLVPITAGYERADLERLNEIALDPAALETYVRYHIIDQLVDLNSATAPFTVETRAGIPIEFTRTPDGQWAVGGITIVNANVPASNGLIHVLDRVLYPPES